jgi:Carboxypeptidase regulatory-like domain
MNASAIRRIVLLFLASLLTMGGLAHAQTGTTSVHGTVVDKSGGAVVAAAVTLLSSEQSGKRETQTSATGQYDFLLVPPGKYTITIEMAGFNKFERTNVELLISQPATVNATLEVGAATQTVEVNAQTLTLNTTDASLGIAFNENQVKELPLEGRNVPDLLSLQPGVVYTGHSSDVDNMVDTRSGSVNGARSDQSNITLDGVSVNTQGGFAFTSVMPVTPDSVQEFRVTTSNYGADQGGSSGAQVALVTKSGTNNYHGALYEYNRNTATSANEYFVKAGQLQACELAGTPLSDPSCNQAPKLIRNVFGGAVGGPIKKDRLFLFLNYEGIRLVSAAPETEQVPSPTLRDGIIQYTCDDPSACPASTVQGMSGATYNIIAGNKALTAAQIAGMDPLGLGPSAVSLAYFKTFPMPNQVVPGDGFNYDGFAWAAPVSDTSNVYIARMDYNITRDAKERFSVSGALQNDVNPRAPFLPGEAPSNSIVNYNKGLIFSLTSALTNNLVNSFRYGYIRESQGDIGNTNQPVVLLRGLNDQTGAVTYTNAFQQPINTFSDDVSWAHGRHSLQFGTTLSFVRSPNVNYTSSFSSASANASWLDTVGIAGTNSPFDPANNGYAAVASGFANSYDYPLMALVGMVSEVDAQYNFNANGTAQPEGAPVARRYGVNSYEFYVQDAWKVKPTLTLTLGLRYSLFSPPWETNGQEVVPNLNLSQWLTTRAQNMDNGIGAYADPSISFQLGGKANGKAGYYNWDYKDAAPRFAFAWAPTFSGDGLMSSLFGTGKTAIRGGIGIVYDRAGQELVNNFDSSGGAFGLSSTLPNPASSQSAQSSPRLTSLNVIPTTDNNGQVIFQPPPPAGFPVTYPAIEAITTGLDQNIKTPYSYTADFSYSRQLSNSFQLEVAYVGRFSHRLLSLDDMAMPTDIFDKASGLDYFKAVTALAKVYRTGVSDNNFKSSMVSPAVVKYWTDIMPAAAPGSAYVLGTSGGCGDGPATTTDPVLAAYDLFCPGSQNETGPLQLWDSAGIPDANGGAPYFPTGHANTFLNPQFSSLYAWRSTGNANYNAMEVTLRHALSHGIQFDFNYTFSKSIDLSSDAERIGTHSGLGGQIINAWSPNQLRAVSDFDATHQFNANTVWDLPFGRNQRFASGANGFTNAIIGGWQVSGIFRLTSGFPVNVSNGAQWPTNWELGGQAFLTGPVKTGQYTITDPSLVDYGSPNVFSNGHDAINSFTNPFPGESGSRNSIRGDGYFGLDFGLSKRWTMPWNDGQSLQFRWEVFNATNAVRFNIQTGSLALDNSSTFGDYTGTLTSARVMQFALRFEF